MKRELQYNEKPLLMGVVNVTPDSFFDGGKFYDPGEALRHALQLATEGAHILDVGGESTRPFSRPVSADEELKRVIPVIQGIRARSDVFISVDTYKAAVAEEALKAGADIVNDISGFLFDSAMTEVVRRYGAYAVVMHIKGTPADMQKGPSYEDVVEEIRDHFEERIDFAAREGVARDQLILDPGIGFGKRVEDNLRIIRMLGSFKDLGLPLLVGPSMKSFIGTVTGAPVGERGEGTIASITMATWNGADIVRVHDVRGARRAVELTAAVMRS
jgi:dihydropteroate synthase